MLVCSLPVWAAAQNSNLAPGFIQELIAEDLNPVAMTLDPNGRVWIAEKDGEVRIVNKAGQLLPTPFITLNVDDLNERGLSGIALHPDFERQPYVYLYYTVPGLNRNRLIRVRANGDLALPGSEEVLLTLEPLNSSIHNGGAMVFGRDSMLYLTVGEGAEPNTAPDLNRLHGKILRLTPEGNIPLDNPFYNQLSGPQRAIYARGFRNPFKLAYDASPHRLWSTDVGNAAMEEVNLIEGGAYYGWPEAEGPFQGGDPPEDYRDPVAHYDHDEGCAATAVAFLPSDLPWPQIYQGALVWGDYCEGFLKGRSPNGDDFTLANDLERPVGLEVDAEGGVMYLLTRAGIGGGSVADNTQTEEGKLWRIRYVGEGAPFIAQGPRSVLVPVGESTTFSVLAQGSSPLSYQWERDGQPLPGATAATLTVDSVSLDQNGEAYRCVVSNSYGQDVSAAALLEVTTNQRPRPEILVPDTSLRFRAGDTLYFSGRAVDPETGPLSDSSLTWWVDLHHDLHTHPAAGPFPGSAEGQWSVPLIYETDPNVWFRVYLAARDTAGLVGVQTRDLHPDLTDLRFMGAEGLELNLDGRSITLPTEEQGLIGLTRFLTAPSPQVIGDTIYRFVDWEDGSTRAEREISTPVDGLTVRPNYAAVPLSRGEGQGLWGTYYADSTLSFSGEIVVSRIDEQVAFLWGGGGPLAAGPTDYFNVRWEGQVEAVLTDRYTFTVRSDDGVRLWVGDQLIIDQWVPQAATDASGQIDLEAGERYPLRLEYMEIEGEAEVTLYWSSTTLPQAVIPQRQLYVDNRANAELWLDADGDGVRGARERALSGESVALWGWPSDQQPSYSEPGWVGSLRAEVLARATEMARATSDEAGRISWNVPYPGLYFVQTDLVGGERPWQASQGLDPAGRSRLWSVVPTDTTPLSLAVRPRSEDWGHPAFPAMRATPNPFTDELWLSYRQWFDGATRVELLDLMGRRIWVEEGPAAAGVHTLTLSPGQLQRGLYLLRISQGSHSRSLWVRHQ